MASLPTPRDRGDFSIVLICAKKEEAENARDVLDKKWNEKQYGRDISDNNAYTLGTIGEHHVVIIHMPGMGTDRAAVAKAHLNASFPNIKLSIVVGVCGGMPYGPKKEEIILGDVIISDALVRYDIGRQYEQGFERKTDIHDILGPPTEKILGVIRKLETRDEKASLQTSSVKFLDDIQEKSPEAKYPSDQKDVLYNSEYTHKHRELINCGVCRDGKEICKDAVKAECEDLGCSEDASKYVRRSRLIVSSTPRPAVHFGTMASGNTVMKSGKHRDALAKDGVLGIEMEGAGVWRYGPTVVIKGVCDYGDSHKRKGWQQYAAATAAAYMKAFLLEWPPDRKQGHSDKHEFNVYFEVPVHRVESLFGREDELVSIAAYFQRSSEDVVRPRILVLQAMGGQGKSQIALEHCHLTDARQTHRGIFWVDGSSSIAMAQSLAAVARHIDGAGAEALPDDESRANLAIRTLERWEHRWLVVFDNCDDAETFYTLRKKFLPKVGKGDLLLTSRHQDLGKLGRLMKIPSMPPDAGVRLLLHRYGSGVNYDEYKTEGRKIVERLGGLALAISQASAYLDYKLIPLEAIQEFLPLYLTRRKEVLEYIDSGLWDYMKIYSDDEKETAVSAFTTWEMSFRQLLDEQKNQDNAIHFFTLSAFLGPTFIEESLFRLYWKMDKPPSEWLKLFSTTEITTTASESKIWRSEFFWHLIRRAHQMSLIQDLSRASESREATFLFHPLIRDWLQLRQVIEDRRLYNREATKILSNYIRMCRDRSSDAQLKTTILLHIGTIIECDYELFSEEDRLGHDESTCNDAYWIAVFYRDRGHYMKSHNLYQIQIATMKRVLGMEHPDTLTSMNNLATVLGNQGKYAEAEQMHRQVLAVRERVSGVEHPNTLTSMNNLAEVLRNQGKYAEADQAHRHTLEVKERVLGVEHPSTLNSMNNLALVLRGQGKYAEAEQAHRHTLEARERVLGVEHPDTLTSMNNLAEVLRNQGKYAEAEQAHRHTLEVKERVLGVEHPDTLTSMNNLALVLRGQGKYAEAEQAHRHELEVKERVLGVEHPSTLTSMNNLAEVLRGQGKYAEAEQAHRHTLEARERVLGVEHPDTLTSMNNLAEVLRNQGKYAEADQAHRHTLEVKERVLGVEHPSTLNSMNNLALVLRGQGKYAEAEQAHRHTLEVKERVLGVEHPSTLTSMNNLAEVLRNQGKYAEAEQAHRHTLEARERVLGVEHPDTLNSMNNLALVLRNQGKFIEAGRIQI